MVAYRSSGTVPGGTVVGVLHRDPRAERYGEALLADAEFLELLDADLAAERRAEVDPGLDREEFLVRYKDVLEPPAD